MPIDDFRDALANLGEPELAALLPEIEPKNRTVALARLKAEASRV